MARNVEIRDRVAGSFSHADSLLYPKTHINMVEGLLTNGKLSLSLLPDGLKTGLKYVATQGTATNTAALLTVITNAATSAGLDSASYPGSFIVTSTAYTLTVSTGHVVKGDDGAGEVAAAGTLALDANDWLVYRGNFATVHNWDVINNTHGLATTSTAGLMAATDKVKLDGIAANANNYAHPTQTGISLDLTDIETINVLTVDTLGHVTAGTKQTIRTGSTTQTGVLQLATGTELTSALSSAKASTPSAVKTTVDYYSGMKRYADLATANAASHADGAIALITVA